MQNAGLDEAQAGVKIAGGNINNLRYADDTILMAEGEEELKSLLMKWKELWNRSFRFKGKKKSQVAQMVKNPPVVQEIWGRSLGWEDPLEEGMATLPSILA